MTSIEINHLCTILIKINYTATYKAWLNFFVVEYHNFKGLWDIRSLPTGRKMYAFK